ncbi:MAG: glycosyltransferase family protein [Candidatus Marinimicrobia bacterium]|nr:glycosyltransferase family protein [Candidatus Neomarinimicrobiota bacterium]
MHILYGIATTGNGHISRSKIIINALKKRGHSVDVILSGREKKDLFDIDELTPYQIKKGFTFSSNKGRISYIKTVLKSNLLEFLKDVESVKNVYNLVITDFDPISAYAAKKYNIPCMGIGHQYSFYTDIPMTKKMKFASIFFPKMYTPVNFTIPFHFYHFNQSILPPFIDPALHKEINTDEKSEDILVYLPWENLDDMIAILQKISKEFIVYTKIASIEKIDNITLKPFSNATFKQDLIRCSSLITNAGFQLPSEALFLGKPMLCKPLKDQPEQEHNAKILKELEYATICDKIDVNSIEHWIKNKIKVQIPFKDPMNLIIDIIENPTTDFSHRAMELWKE